MNFRPALSILRPNDAIVKPCAVSWTATTRNRPSRKTSAPMPILSATTNGVP